MFGESQTSLGHSKTSRLNLHFIEQRFLIKKPVKKIACLSEASLRFLGLRRLEISRNIRKQLRSRSIY